MQPPATPMKPKRGRPKSTGTSTDKSTDTATGTAIYTSADKSAGDNPAKRSKYMRKRSKQPENTLLPVMAPQEKGGIGEVVFETMIAPTQNVKLLPINGDFRMDIRHMNMTSDKFYPTKKGVCLVLDQVFELQQCVLSVDEALNEIQRGQGVTMKIHIKHNVFVRVSKDFKGVDIRKFFRPLNNTAGELVPTRRGVFLKLDAWKLLKDILMDLEQILPDYKDFVPCHMKSDHLDLINRLSCPKCNPDTYMQW